MPKPLTIVEAMIEQDESLSPAIDIRAGAVVGLATPDNDWTSALVTLQASPDGGEYYDVYSDNKELAFNAVPNAIFSIDADKLRAARYLKIRSGTAKAPVPQEETQLFLVLLEADAVAEGATPPVVDSVEPASAAIGDPDLELVVIGSGFTADSVIVFNGGDEPTVFHDAMQLSTGVKPSLVSAAVAVPVAVRNGSTMSNEMMFSFTAAAGRR